MTEGDAIFKNGQSTDLKPLKIKDLEQFHSQDPLSPSSECLKKQGFTETNLAL